MIMHYRELRQKFEVYELGIRLKTFLKMKPLTKWKRYQDAEMVKKTNNMLNVHKKYLKIL